MTDWSYETCDPVYQDRSSRTRKVFVRTIPALAAFSFSAAVALRLAGGLAGDAGVPSDVGLHAAAQAAGPQSTTSGQTPESGAFAKSAAVAVAHVALESGPTKPDMDKPRNPFGGLFDPDLASTGMTGMAAQNDPVGPSFSPLQSEPLFVLVETPDSASQIAEADTNQQVAEAEPAQADSAQANAGQAIAQALANVPLPPLRTAQVAEAEPPAAVADGHPLPPTRPSELSNIARVAVDVTPRREIAPPATPLPAPPTRAAAAASVRERAQATTFARNDPRSLFDKLFTGNSEQKGPQLAYASQEGGGGGLFNLSRGPSASPSPVVATGGTAVYDISAHTVYLPNGQALEAHSGLGPYFDHPGYVHVRMRGSTPPATYQLTLRESLFHGVQALRLTPLDSNVHGRNGLLAHTFMLGQRGDSNGCVSFRNYRAFLDAYMRGEIRQLKVVASR
ncbi:DUF2778 domain-containing protein [Rhodoblastus sp.]|jgi:hypothetical protein|uniref:DUF2778 domain-containing protein n=1 Tax=Rhodoblastus sp. TaxID=1962975 RepID=UPI0025EA8183|nr:DUF2778 domain-containing protein [Rhodoblastus sp.]